MTNMTPDRLEAVREYAEGRARFHDLRDGVRAAVAAGCPDDDQAEATTDLILDIVAQTEAASIAQALAENPKLRDRLASLVVELALGPTLGGVG